MNYVVITFLWLSILLYFVLGGADFGAGIIELFTSSHQVSRTRRTLYHAIGPIWEANHMWLIIAVVILFVGFPVIYTQLSIYLHIPMLIMLLGITARGTAFVFRHYDAVRDEMQELYNRVFVWSSFVTPLFLGIIAGSTVSGQIQPDAKDFLTAYVYGWFNWFSVAVGFFTVALCGFLAAVYLIGEAEDERDRREFIRKARNANLIAIACGVLVFVAAEIDNVPLMKWVFKDAVGLLAVSAATVSLIALWALIRRKRRLLLRLLVSFQVTMILLAISYAHFPNIIIMANGESLSLYEYEAPAKTLAALGWALLVGSLFILPALFYLYYSFQIKKMRHFEE
ncbi:cytochrome bd-I ubiquinol oxidase subunit 2 apoprotein [Chryseolinea serpens]|uniref:Cytochrome bd-I ubiquinol oxidase subunit 2 apoprotein n=1 Tax=Chryseolinea serpens TaxID=947013 RepID=A0A1M5JM74_9BACT|nr:cytochrome d ubiquinol oxidase subunit II [Chryseolinea serpens]SHG41495.1 cytochrome bd-I ubiquinol oxidase subunit 2 apoprotein [Chryseolinea serpens]